MAPAAVAAATAWVPTTSTRVPLEARYRRSVQCATAAREAGDHDPMSVAHPVQYAHSQHDRHADGDRCPDQDGVPPRAHGRGGTRLDANQPRRVESIRLLTSAARALHEEHHHGEGQPNDQHHPGEAADIHRLERPSHRGRDTRGRGVAISDAWPAQYPSQPAGGAPKLFAPFFHTEEVSADGLSRPADQG